MGTERWRRIILAVELALGVLPIALVGGFYALMGITFGAVSVLVSIGERSFSGFTFWIVVVALGVGGLIGILGLSLLILVSELGGSQSVKRVALGGTLAGVATSITALILSVRESGLSWLVAYLLTSPVLVAIHYGFREWSMGHRVSRQTRASSL